MRSLPHHQRLGVTFLAYLFVASHASLECPVGFGSTELQVISEDRINDNFCDCPTNGADEPETNACAGLEYWPGINEAPIDASPVFTCPQQPTLQISVSKVQDGICDCCDGADELPGTCDDHCEVLLAAERAQRAKVKDAFDAGYGMRQAAIQEFATLVQTVQVQVQDKEATLQQLDETVEQCKRKVEDWKLQYAKARLAQVEAINTQVLSSQLSALRALTNDELVDFIVHACQVAGELEDATDSKTCIPLRLAGLDTGLRWESKTYERIVLRESEEGMNILANLFYHNVKHDKKSWSGSSLPKPQHGRRLTRVEDDDAYMTDDMYDEPDDDDDVADRLHREMEEKRRGRQGDSRMSGEEDDDEGGVNRDDVIQSLRKKPFSKSRVSFLEQSTSIVDLIERVTKQNESEPGDEPGEGEAPEKEALPEYDPETLPAVKSRIEQLTKRINRGIDYGVSAKVLLGAFDSYKFIDDDTERKDLLYLAVGTVNHGKLSLVHIWHIMRSVVAELQVGDAANAETCASPWASVCPPKIMERKVSAAYIKIPDGALLKAAMALCERQASADLSQVCTAENVIPSELSDGYLGYFVAEPRDDTDDLNSALAALSLGLDEASQKELALLEEAMDSSGKEKKATETSISELKASVGGDNPEKYGPDGELHSIKDSCFSITSGKYTYELCMFGKAQQKEGSGVGTDLGRWSEATVEEESGRRMWKWNNGAKCWNGPQRSATAYVTCGKETTILNADEPETCKYVMEVESYIACDDAFRLQHQLE